MGRGRGGAPFQSTPPLAASLQEPLEASGQFLVAKVQLNSYHGVNNVAF